MIRWSIGAVLVLVAAALLFFFWPSEEGRVRARLAALAEAASVPANEADLARLARAQRVRAGLKEDVRVEFERTEWPSLTGRDAVAALVARPWPGASQGLTIELEDLTISIAADGETADARCKARISSNDREREPVALDGRMVSVTLHRVGGEWLVAGARVLRSDDALQ